MTRIIDLGMALLKNITFCVGHVHCDGVTSNEFKHLTMQTLTDSPTAAAMYLERVGKVSRRKARFW